MYVLYELQGDGLLITNDTPCTEHKVRVSFKQHTWPVVSNWKCETHVWYVRSIIVKLSDQIEKKKKQNEGEADFTSDIAANYISRLGFNN